MKNTITVLVLSYATCIMSQSNVKLSYSSIHSGRNFAITYGKILKKYELGLGIKKNLNSLVHDNQNNVYKKRLYAKKPYQYLGIEAYVHRTIIDNWKTVKPFLFYDVQLARSSTRGEYYTPVGYDYSTNTVLYKQDILFFGPFTWIEQNIGVGFNAQLNNRFSLQQKIGAGTVFIIGHDDHLLSQIFDKFDWELGSLLNVSLVYRVGK